MGYRESPCCAPRKASNSGKTTVPRGHRGSQQVRGKGDRALLFSARASPVPLPPSPGLGATRLGPAESLRSPPRDAARGSAAITAPTAAAGDPPRGAAAPPRSAGGDAPHQQGQEGQQEGHRRPPRGPVDLALTVAGSRTESRFGEPGGARASAGGRAVQPLGAHGLGGVRVGLDAALGKAPVVDALEEVGVTCGADGNAAGLARAAPSPAPPEDCPTPPG